MFTFYLYHIFKYLICVLRSVCYKNVSWIRSPNNVLNSRYRGNFSLVCNRQPTFIAQIQNITNHFALKTILISSTPLVDTHKVNIFNAYYCFYLNK